MRKLLIFLFCSFSQGGCENGITFEPAEPHEAEFLTRLSIDSNAHWNYRKASPATVNQIFTVTPQHIKNGTVRLMKKQNEIIGFLGLRNREAKDGKRVNELTFLFLKRDYIGKGYGKLLFQEAVRIAKEELGWQAMLWESDPFAAPFYKKMGAKQIGSNICPLNNNYNSPLFVLAFD
jgi:GNAT superfamily N-acetyltransferase